MPTPTTTHLITHDSAMVEYSVPLLPLDEQGILIGCGKGCAELVHRVNITLDGIDHFSQGSRQGDPQAISRQATPVEFLPFVKTGKIVEYSSLFLANRFAELGVFSFSLFNIMA
jgi:hypothetical protein